MTDKFIEEVLSRDNDDDLPLEIRQTANKGRGVFTLDTFSKGDIILEYCGDLISEKEGLRREDIALRDPSNTVSYLYFFKALDKYWCLDATEETGRKARLINHSRLNPNVKPKVVIYNGRPRLIFIATCDIPKDTELLYDYGERRKDIIERCEWLRD
jgi:histone-lysine N-methyltransferase SETD8